MLVIMGRAETDPATLPELRAALAEMMAATRTEAGCLAYSLSVEDEGGPDRPAVIAIGERWADIDSLRAHLAAPHMAAFNRRAAGRIRNLDVKLYRVAEELPFPSPAS